MSDEEASQNRLQQHERQPNVHNATLRHFLSNIAATGNEDRSGASNHVGRPKMKPSASMARQTQLQASTDLPTVPILASGRIGRPTERHGTTAVIDVEELEAVGINVACVDSRPQATTTRVTGKISSLEKTSRERTAVDNKKVSDLAREEIPVVQIKAPNMIARPKAALERVSGYTRSQGACLRCTERSTRCIRMRSDCTSCIIAGQRCEYKTELLKEDRPKVLDKQSFMTEHAPDNSSVEPKKRSTSSLADFDDARGPTLSAYTEPKQMSLQGDFITPSPTSSGADQTYEQVAVGHKDKISAQEASTAQRRRVRPTQGDLVLLRQMDPNRPDIAKEASLRVIDSGSETESEGEINAYMEAVVSGATNKTAKTPTPVRPPDVHAQKVQRSAFFTREPRNPEASAVHGDGVIDDDVLKVSGSLTDRSLSLASNIILNGIHPEPETSTTNFFEAPPFPPLNMPQRKARLQEKHPGPRPPSHSRSSTNPATEYRDTEPELRQPHPGSSIASELLVQDAKAYLPSAGGSHADQGIELPGIRTPQMIMNARRELKQAEQRKKVEDERWRASIERETQAGPGQSDERNDFSVPQTEPGNIRTPQTLMNTRRQPKEVEYRKMEDERRSTSPVSGRPTRPQESNSNFPISQAEQRNIRTPQMIIDARSQRAQAKQGKVEDEHRPTSPVSRRQAELKAVEQFLTLKPGDDVDSLEMTGNSSLNPGHHYALSALIQKAQEIEVDDLAAGTASYTPTIDQAPIKPGKSRTSPFTQAQLDNYYAQYQCDPPLPYQVAPSRRAHKDKGPSNLQSRRKESEPARRPSTELERVMLDIMNSNPEETRRKMQEYVAYSQAEDLRDEKAANNLSSESQASSSGLHSRDFTTSVAQRSNTSSDRPGPSPTQIETAERAGKMVVPEFGTLVPVSPIPTQENNTLSSEEDHMNMESPTITLMEGDGKAFVVRYMRPVTPQGHGFESEPRITQCETNTALDQLLDHLDETNDGVGNIRLSNAGHTSNAQARSPAPLHDMDTIRPSIDKQSSLIVPGSRSGRIREEAGAAQTMFIWPNTTNEPSWQQLEAKHKESTGVFRSNPDRPRWTTESAAMVKTQRIRRRPLLDQIVGTVIKSPHIPQEPVDNGNLILSRLVNNSDGNGDDLPALLDANPGASNSHRITKSRDEQIGNHEDDRKREDKRDRRIFEEVARENAKQVQIKLDHPAARERERAERAYAEKENDRTQARDNARRQADDDRRREWKECEETDRKKERAKQHHSKDEKEVGVQDEQPLVPSHQSISELYYEHYDSYQSTAADDGEATSPNAEYELRQAMWTTRANRGLSLRGQYIAKELFDGTGDTFLLVDNSRSFGLTSEITNEFPTQLIDLSRLHPEPPRVVETDSKSPFTDLEIDVMIGDRFENIRDSETPEHRASPPNRWIRDHLDRMAINESSKDVNMDDDASSVISHYAESVASIFSIASATSSATDFSRASGYSASQIATASKELLSIFLQDPSLSILYQIGIKTPGIGPERMRRNLRRLLKAYARQLKEEASDALEALAAQLVLMKAGSLAHAIVEKFESGIERISNRPEDSSGEEQEGDSRPVNEDSLHDLVAFREFLVKSNAFAALRDQIQAFVSPSLPPASVSQQVESCAKQTRPMVTTEASMMVNVQSPRTENLRLDQPSQSLRILSEKASGWIPTVQAKFITFMAQFGLTEPALQPGMSRLRWQCPCGDNLFSDVREVREGGIAALAAQMLRTSGVKVSVSSYDKQTGNQQYRGVRPINWLRNATTKVSISLSRSSKTTSHLPQHNAPCAATAPTPHHVSPPQQVLHLLSCLHRDRFRKVLQQDRVEEVTTDRNLMCLLRQQYLHHRGRFLHLAKLKRVKGISFTKLRLPIGGSVDIQHHTSYCSSLPAAPSACECVPPLAKVEPSPTAEYRCLPGPPATIPPISPEYFASLLTCPTEVHEKDTWILDQLPKRICGKLQGQIGQPAEGWGIYYEEGWDRDLIVLMIFLFFVLGSLLFGILWSRYHFDVQGAFGVSAYMIAASAGIITVIVTRAEKW